MFMKKSNRLQSILRLAEYRENSAIRGMVDSRRKVQQEQQKLEQLVSFQEQYSNRLNNSVSQGIAVSQLMEYREFLYRIGRAIQEQEQVVDGMNESHDVHSTAWRSARSHKLGIDQVWASARSRELDADARREQSEIDNRPAHREE